MDLQTSSSGAIHTSGSLQSYSGSALRDANWYFDAFLPKMKGYHKGPIVYERSKVKKDADSAGRQWAIVNGSVYDLTDYFYTVRFLSTPSHALLVDS
jgi:chitin synthase